MIGETIKDFKITERLGKGGMGEVWVAEQQIIKTRVAIKILLGDVSTDKQQVQRFFNEAIAVSKIKHAGILKIYDVGFHSSGRAYLIMELLEGETLASRIQRVGRLPLGDVADIGRQIASVLAATHAAGVTHRDLKPDNIFLVGDAELASGERAKVLDFGIAKLSSGVSMSGLTGTGSSLGTPAYMAPEQWTDASKADAKADVYSLGCVAFEMACGRMPFEPTSIGEACSKHLHEAPPQLRSIAPELPRELEDLIDRMLAKKPHDRPTMVEVGTAFVASVAGNPVALAPTMPSAHSSRSDRETPPSKKSPDTTLRAAAGMTGAAEPPRRRAGLVVAVLAVVIVGGGGVAYLSVYRSHNAAHSDGGSQRSPVVDPTSAVAPTHASVGPLRAIDVEKFLSAQAASLTSKGAEFVESFDDSAIAFFPDSLALREGHIGIVEGSRQAWGRGGAPDNVATHPVAVGISHGLAWVTTTWSITLADGKSLSLVRVTEILSRDEAGLRVLVASFSVPPPAGSAGFDGAAPGFTLGVAPADGPESWLARPARLVQSILNDPAASLFGSDVNEYAIGAEAVRKLLTSWKSVKLDLVGNVRIVDGPGYKIVLAVARWAGPQPTLFRVLALFVAGEVPTGPSSWKLATAQYAVVVPKSGAATAVAATPATTCPAGMSPVARGTFSMGSPDDRGDANEHPAHQVTVNAFCIDTTEVTVAAYASCVNSGQCSPAGTGGSCNAGRPDRLNHPINCVTWDEAVAFCGAFGKRLPTEAEWEFAARGTDGRDFAWGNDPPSAQRLNACGAECTSKQPDRLFTDSDGWPETAPVGSYRAGASASGALDMAGNVWEWTADWMGPYSADAVVDPKGPPTGKGRVYRGGGWGSRDVGSVRAARRRADLPAASDDSLGFRCAK